MRAISVIFGILCAVGTCSAETRVYEDSLPVNSGIQTGSGAGEITHIKTTYNSTSERLTFSSTVSSFGSNPKLWDGFWLVLSPGVAPGDPGAANEDFVIFYGDFSSTKQTGTPMFNAYPALQAFVYNGDASNPWATSPNHFLEAFDPNVEGLEVDDATDGSSRTASFDIDVSTVNQGKSGVTDGDFLGAGFGEQIGIWFQPVYQDNDPKSSYTSGGILTLFEMKKKSWYDTLDTPQDTVAAVVPEPTSLSLWSLGALGLLLCRRRRD